MGVTLLFHIVAGALGLVSGYVALYAARAQEREDGHAALLVAAMSFFLGQADELPEAIRQPPLLALPVLAVLATLLYWLWRVRIRRSLRGMRLLAAAPQGEGA